MRSAKVELHTADSTPLMPGGSLLAWQVVEMVTANGRLDWNCYARGKLIQQGFCSVFARSVDQAVCPPFLTFIPIHQRFCFFSSCVCLPLDFHFPSVLPLGSFPPSPREVNTKGDGRFYQIELEAGREGAEGRC